MPFCLFCPHSYLTKLVQVMSNNGGNAHSQSGGCHGIRGGRGGVCTDWQSNEAVHLNSTQDQGPGACLPQLRIGGGQRPLVKRVVYENLQNGQHRLNCAARSTRSVSSQLRRITPFDACADTTICGIVSHMLYNRCIIAFTRGFKTCTADERSQRWSSTWHRYGDQA